MALNEDKGVDSTVSYTFGRAPYLAFVEADETGEIKEIKIESNSFASNAGGVGAQVSQFIANSGAKAVIAGSFGPNAYNVLSAADVRMYTMADITVKEAVKRHASGIVPQLGEPGTGTGRGFGRRMGRGFGGVERR